MGGLDGPNKLLTGAINEELDAELASEELLLPDEYGWW
jgi:hypothetical protein